MKNTGFKIILICLASALVCLAGPLVRLQEAQAHPHVFIEQKMEIRFDDKGLEGFKINWGFDEMFSVMIAEDFDTDKNGSLDKKEVAVIREKAFGYIAPYNYYIHIKIEGRPFAVKYITEFNARLDKGKLFYEFFIPCHVSAVKPPKKIVVAPYDPEYYSALYFSEHRPVRIVKPDRFKVETSVGIDKSTSIYYDMVNPWAMFLSFRLK